MNTPTLAEKLERAMRAWIFSSAPKDLLPMIQSVLDEHQKEQESEITSLKLQIEIFRWHILAIHRNEYHDRSDKERADEYLKKWSECEKECRGWRMLALGEVTPEFQKKWVRDHLGVDLDEGTIR